MAQSSFPGPAIAVSSTGQNLAQGPRGIPGPQGPPGIPGPAGAYVVSVQYLATASPSKQIIISGQDQAVSVDASAGAVTCVAPTIASCSDGQTFSMKDNTNSWGANQVSLSMEGGAAFEDPQNPGTYVTGTLALAMVNSNLVKWRLYKSLSKWGRA